MSCQLCESAPVDCYDCHQRSAVDRENRLLHMSVKEWSDDYNQLSKEFQHYREEKEALILQLRDQLEELAQRHESFVFSVADTINRR